MRPLRRPMLRTLASIALLTLAACSGDAVATETTSAAGPSPATDDAGLAVATFAGGCFWCMEEPFDLLDGVVSTTSGYTDGWKKNPTYKQVTSGTTGHTEAVQVRYDPSKVTFEQLLDVFWHNIDPTVKDRQFCDWGSQYRTGVYYHDDAQRLAAEASKEAILAAGTVDKIKTEIDPATTFYPAEDYHQNFYVKSSVRYKSYRAGCGRDRRLRQIWGDQAGH